MLTLLTTWFFRMPLWLRSPVLRVWYEGMSALDREANMVFMNYGWAGGEGDARAVPLLPEDEPNRYCIQLYHRVASAVDLAGLDVLEVGCGRGGGASYVMRYLQPRSLTGVDRARRAIAFCRGHYKLPGLTFVRGDAEALDYDENTFDAVVNVESSHCYLGMDRFLAGVCRVLKPGGYLLFADTRDQAAVPTLRRQFREAGLAAVEEELLNEAVVRALELDNARKKALIQAKVPRLLRPSFDQFAAIEGTASVYERLRRGEKQYLRFVLQA